MTPENKLKKESFRSKKLSSLIAKRRYHSIESEED